MSIMSAIEGYTHKEQLHQSPRSTLYRAIRRADQTSVAIKSSTAHFPNVEFDPLQRELDIASKLNHPGLLRAYEITQDCQGSPALILEYFQGKPLDTGCAQGLSLPLFFNIAIRLTQTLEHILQNGYFHHNIHAGNVLWAPDTEELRLVGLWACTELMANAEHNIIPLSGLRISHISPEQTGRMDQAVDYRSCFYSLGVTFYQLLTGQLPFAADDVKGWYHCHVAQLPQKPSLVNPALSEILSEMVMKLLSKNVADRYQTFAGLLHDLQRCRGEFERSGKLDLFPLAQQDQSTTFNLTRQLFGREREIAQIVQAIKTAAHSPLQLHFIAGNPGVGKTALVEQVIGSGEGFFIQGKFEQLEHNIPYSALIQAFKALLQQLLILADDTLAMWKQCLVDALSPNAQLIIELIPELEIIIGPQPAVQTLGLEETRQRFFNTMRRFVNVFAQADAPLVIFLDDLQWSDQPTLQLIEEWAASDDLYYVLIVGAYRNNEVGPAHALAQTIEKINTTVEVSQCDLNPIDSVSISHIVADSLQCELQVVQPLAEILYQKTAGNPFYLTSLLAHWVEKKHLYFCHKKGGWHWQLQHVNPSMVNLPILELLKHRLETLSKPCLQLLRMAACIGHRFELMLLSAVAKTDSASIKKNLQEAVQRGVILELKPEREQDRVNEKIMYQFEHDQLQQVCYEFVEEDDKAGLHLVIARWLLQASEGDDKEVLLMRIVEHYNAGSALISNQQERTDLARLDLAAVEKSKAAAAYQPALAYIESATNLLAADAWETDYALTFAIYQHYSDCAHLCSDFERAEKINTLLLQQAKTPLEKGQIYLLQCQQYALSKNHALAIDKGLEGLAVFGVKMSATPSRLAILWQFFLAKWYLRGRTPQDLLAQEFVTNRELQTIMKLYQEIIQPAVYSGRRKLFVITGMRALVHSLRQGNTAESAFSYVAYGFILSHYLNDPKKGDEFGKLSLAMAERCQDDKVKCRSLHGHTISNLCWSQPWETITETLSDAIKVAERCGDVYIIPQIRLDQIMWNPRLEYSAAAEQIKKLYLFSERHKNKHGMIGSRIYYQRITNILGKTHHLLSLNSDGFDTDKFLEDAPPSHHNFIKTLYFVCHLEFIFFYENYAGIVKLLRQKGHLIKSLVGHPSTVQISFTAFLSLSLALQNVSFYNKAFVKRRMKSAYKKMKKWADHCPINFLHRQLLMEAEFARHAKDYHQAEQRYDQAIQTAQQNGFLRDEAVANELAAKYYLSQGRTRIASDYFTAAKAGYEHISMIAKLRHMEQHYADLLALKTDTAQPDASNPPVNLDLDTVRDGIELIATEDNIDQVLQQVIRLLLENAGAQRICLFLLQEDTLHLEVEGIHDKTLTIQRRTCPLDEVNTLPTAIIHHTARKKQAFLLSDADEHPWLAQDPYLQQHPTISILSMPLLYAGELSGLIYLENTSTDAAFTPQRLEIVKILGFQAMAAINHIRSSELKDEALQEKALAIEKLQRADTIKDEFLANTSHELRTPLHGIIGITESLLDGAKGTLDPTVSADLDLVVSSSKRLTHLVNDLLDAAQLKHRAIRLEQKALDLLSIVQLILRLNSAHAEHKSLQLLNEVPDFLPAVWADENRLYQILQGLIGNAIKFTDSGQITVSATRQDETLCITVTDTGRGIPAGQWQRIFQSFEQIEASQTKTQQGSGLGLSITKALVELHGGRIWLESIPGQGSHFHFTLPLSHTVAIAETNPVIARIEAPLQSPPAFNAVAATTAGLFQILVVDDDPINLQIVSRYLADQPYQIITAASGQEALQKVAQAKPDLILLDVMMPHLDGFDVCRQIRATYPDYELPIIFLTARYQSTQITELVVQTDQAGGDDYLTRPFSKDELRSKIARQLSWLTLIRRSQALGQFGNQIAQLNDIDQLHQATFELLANDNYIQDIALFREDTLVCCRGDQQQLEQVFQVCNKAQAKNKASITPFNWDDKDYLFIQLQEQASLLAHLPFALAEIEEKLLHNMIYPAIHQIGINQDNLHKFVHDPKFLSNTYKISNELKTIHYIEADGHDVKVYSNKHRSGELLEIAIGKVTSCFNDCLLPVHRSYLVNPDWVIRAQRRANHFDLVVGHRHYTKKVPIGDKYLQGIREDYAMWFEK